MFMQLGFRTALFESAVLMHSSLQGDIVLISPRSTAIISMEEFTERRLYQAQGFAGVESVTPIYLDQAVWKNPAVPSKTRNIQIYGIKLKDTVFNLQGISENLEKLKQPDTVLFDRGSRAEFGPVVQLFQQNKSVITEAESRAIKVVGLFTLGVSFGSDGTLVTSDLNFFRIFSQRHQIGLINIGLIKLKPGANQAEVIKNLREHLPNDVRVLSKKEYQDFEVSYWNSSTPIGFIFALGTAMGFIVGMIIVYQVLYTGISDHLPEYATLKAIGYADFYFTGVVLQSAIILASLGFFPGFTLASGLYSLTRNATFLPLYMNIDRVVLVFSLTLLMCFISGVISLNKLRAADPADIF